MYPHNLIYLKDNQKYFNDVLIKQFTSKVTIILAGHTLGKVLHGNKVNKLVFLHVMKNRNSISNDFQRFYLINGLVLCFNFHCTTRHNPKRQVIWKFVMTKIKIMKFVFRKIYCRN